MKRLLFNVGLILLTPLLMAQTVENIRVEQEGEKLNIHYRIGGSTAGQLYFVTLTCSVDGGTPFEPVSVIGDVGANIRGGKSYNTIVWDVFDDMEEIGSVEFFVKVELTSDEREKGSETVTDDGPVKAVGKTAVKPGLLQGKPDEAGEVEKYRKYFIGYDGSSYNPLGVRIGTLGNWGVMWSLRYGGYDYFYYSHYITMTAGVTKRFFQFDRYRLHGYAGLGVGYFGDQAELELGLIVVLNRVNINIGATANQFYNDGTIGVGFVF